MKGFRERSRNCIISTPEMSNLHLHLQLCFKFENKNVDNKEMTKTQIFYITNRFF